MPARSSARTAPKRKRTHLSLVAANETPIQDKYEALFHQASDAILTVDEKGFVDAANEAAEDLTGYLAGELEGRALSDLQPDEKKLRLPERSRAFDSRVAQMPGTHEDIAVLRQDGYLRLTDLTVRKVSGTRKALWQLLFRDVTEKKRMERELITKHAELRNAYMQLEKKNAELQSIQDTLVQAGKMAALGELAAGIAHELNQPLQGVRGYAQELRDQPEGPGRQEWVKEIISCADKMSAIIDHLRSFTRKSVEKHEFTAVSTAIHEALKLLQRQLTARGIEVIQQIDSKLPDVYANPLQLEQVFINLASNARDAIDATERGKGRLTIRAKKQGPFVEIEFEDDGIGMSDRTRAKIFNPFFTTKEVGKGMGLGLSLSYGMIAKLHGTIVAESEFGKGAVFKVRIPIDFREAG